MIEVLAHPYDARQCPECKVWVYTADGPFAEDNDPTKTEADWLHWRDEHYTDADKIGPNAIGFPFFRYNDEPVTAVKENRELDP